jgi:hypothetical protein
MKKNLSANTLFHFTNKLEYFLGILENDFSPRYCAEDWTPLTGDDSILDKMVAIPMVCFCDIPLSQIGNHMNVYGSYAIGLKKEWGIKNKLTPLLYCHNDSDIATSLKIIRKSDSKFTKEALVNLVDILRYVKPYEGKFINKLGETIDVRFYDEREWRYVPAKAMRIKREKEKIDFPVSLYNSQFLTDGEIDKTKLEEANRKISEFKLTFTPDDIKYIIIEKEIDRLKIAEKIKSVKGKFSYESIQTLITKIITKEQIIDDF